MNHDRRRRASGGGEKEKMDRSRQFRAGGQVNKCPFFKEGSVQRDEWRQFDGCMPAEMLLEQPAIAVERVIQRPHPRAMRQARDLRKSWRENAVYKAQSNGRLASQRKPYNIITRFFGGLGGGKPGVDDLRKIGEPPRFVFWLRKT